MTTPGTERILVDLGGVVVAERGPLILVVDRGTGPLATVSFVLAVIAVVVGGFGVFALIFALTSDQKTGLPTEVAAAFVVVGVAVGIGALAVYRAIRARRARPLDSYRPAAVFDRARRVFADADGTVIAPLDQIQFRRSLQIGSSSPKLVVATPQGEVILKRGNPFDGGIGTLDEVLTAAVHDTR